MIRESWEIKERIDKLEYNLRVGVNDDFVLSDALKNFRCKKWIAQDSELEFLQKILDVYEDDKELHDDYFYVTIKQRIKELMNDEN